MATANERLLDEAIRHAVELNKYSNHVVQRMIAVLNRADRRLFAELIEALSRFDPDSFTVQRLQDMLASVMQLNAAAFDAVQRELTQELRDFLVYAVDYERAMLVNAIPVRVPVATLAADQVYAAAMARPFQGVLLREALKDVSAQRAKTIRQRLAQGFVEGRTIPDMVRELRGTRAKGYADGLLQRSRRDIEAITRTAVSHMAGFARDRSMEANRDIVRAVRWVSTLDLRTTVEICVPRDGKLYHPVTHAPIDHDLPWLGGAGRAHWNCRSTSVPVLRSWKELTGVDIPEFTPESRASMDGQVPATMDYQTWLSKQSAARQDEVLGPTRGKLLREGGLGVKDLYNHKGRFLSLAELRERDAKAFQSAGL